MSQTVAIFGATGAQGAPVAREALAKGMSVRAVARDAAKIAPMHPGAQAVAADLNDVDDLTRALEGVDAAFFHLPLPGGPDDSQTWLKAFITAAHAARLPLLVYSTSGPSGKRFPSSMVIDGTTAGANAVAACGIPAIILQPAIYLENLLPPVFSPRLRTEGIADYPPLRQGQKIMWTSHNDQAAIAVAALGRPELAGNSYEIGSPDALTGAQLAVVLGEWLGRPVNFDPITPAEFGQRVGDAFGNQGLALALTDLYGALARLPDDGMDVDIQSLEETFGVSLTSVADHVKGWSSS